MSVVKSMYNEKSPKFELESKSVFPLYIPRNNKMFQKVVLFLSLEFFPGGKLCSILLIQASPVLRQNLAVVAKTVMAFMTTYTFAKTVKKKKTEFARGP